MDSAVYRRLVEARPTRNCIERGVADTQESKRGKVFHQRQRNDLVRFEVEGGRTGRPCNQKVHKLVKGIEHVGGAERRIIFDSAATS